MKAKDFVKLGTGLRYLIDVQLGTSLGGKYILQNIKTVQVLIKELGFASTLASPVFTQLRKLEAKLELVSTTVPTISNTDADELHSVCRRIRDSLFFEGDEIELVGKGNKAGLSVPDI